MAKQKISGLIERNGTWHIDKRYKYAPTGRIRCSCRTSDREEAEQYLIHIMNEYRNAQHFGVRIKRTFREAAAKYLLDNQHHATIDKEILHLQQLMPFIGDLVLNQIHDGTLQPFIKARQKQGRKNKTINLALSIVRRILNLAARSWRDDHGNTWLDQSPLITMLPLTNSKKPYPLDWNEQDTLFSHLASHLRTMASFKVNTGLRDTEVCGLKWSWEIDVPELQTSVFIIPQENIKNREERLVVLNTIAKSVINEQRAKRPKQHTKDCLSRKSKPCNCAHGYVFHYRKKKIVRMHNNAWKASWKKAGLPVGDVYTRGPHNLKHTFGRRLRAAGVTIETRKVLLGHTNGDITTHYSQFELLELIEAANRVCTKDVRKMPTLTILKTKPAED